MMEKREKKEYVKPEVARVKLVVEGPVLGNCWTDYTTQPDSDTCNLFESCPL